MSKIDKWPYKQNAFFPVKFAAEKDKVTAHTANRRYFGKLYTLYSAECGANRAL